MSKNVLNSGLTSVLKAGSSSSISKKEDGQLQLDLVSPKIVFIKGAETLPTNFEIKLEQGKTITSVIVNGVSYSVALGDVSVKTSESGASLIDLSKVVGSGEISSLSVVTSGGRGDIEGSDRDGVIDIMPEKEIFVYTTKLDEDERWLTTKTDDDVTGENVEAFPENSGDEDDGVVFGNGDRGFVLEFSQGITDFEYDTQITFVRNSDNAELVVNVSDLDGFGVGSFGFDAVAWAAIKDFLKSGDFATANINYTAKAPASNGSMITKSGAVEIKIDGFSDDLGFDVRSRIWSDDESGLASQPSPYEDGGNKISDTAEAHYLWDAINSNTNINDERVFDRDKSYTNGTITQLFDIRNSLGQKVGDDFLKDNNIKLGIRTGTYDINSSEIQGKLNAQGQIVPVTNGQVEISVLDDTNPAYVDYKYTFKNYHDAIGNGHYDINNKFIIIRHFQIQDSEMGKVGAQRFEILSGTGADGFDIKSLNAGDYIKVFIPTDAQKAMMGKDQDIIGWSENISALTEFQILGRENNFVGIDPNSIVTTFEEDEAWSSFDAFSNNNGNPSNGSDNGVPTNSFNLYNSNATNVTVKILNPNNEVSFTIFNDDGSVVETFNAVIVYNGGSSFTFDQATLDKFVSLTGTQYAVADNFEYQICQDGTNFDQTFTSTIKIDGLPDPVVPEIKVTVKDVILSDDEDGEESITAPDSYGYSDEQEAIDNDSTQNLVFSLNNLNANLINVVVENAVGNVTKEFSIKPTSGYVAVPASDPSDPASVAAVDGYFYTITSLGNDEYLYTKFKQNPDGTYQKVSPASNNAGMPTAVQGMTIDGVKFMINPSNGEVTFDEQFMQALAPTQHVGVFFSYCVKVTDSAGNMAESNVANGSIVILGVDDKGDPQDPFIDIDPIVFVEDENDFIIDQGGYKADSGVYFANNMVYTDSDSSQQNPNTFTFELTKASSSSGVQGYGLNVGDYAVDGIDVKLYQVIPQPAGNPAGVITLAYKIIDATGTPFAHLNGKEFIINFDSVNATFSLSKDQMQVFKEGEVFKFGLKYFAILSNGEKSAMVDASAMIVGDNPEAVNDTLNANAGQAGLIGNLLANDVNVIGGQQNPSTGDDGDDLDVGAIKNAVFTPVNGAAINLVQTFANGVYTLTGTINGVNVVTIRVDKETGNVSYDGSVEGVAKFDYAADGLNVANNAANNALFNGLDDNGDMDWAQANIVIGKPILPPPDKLPDIFLIDDEDDDSPAGVLQGVDMVDPANPVYKDEDDDTNNNPNDLNFSLIQQGNIAGMYDIVEGVTDVNGTMHIVKNIPGTNKYTYEIKGGIYDGKVFEFTHNAGSPEFTFTTADMQFLADNEAMKLVINYELSTIVNGLKVVQAIGKANVVIIGEDEDTTTDLIPDLNFTEDEDDASVAGLQGIDPVTGINYVDKSDDVNNDLTDIEFTLAQNGNPANGQYTIKTGVFNVDGTQHIVEQVAGTNDKYTYTIKGGVYDGKVFTLTQAPNSPNFEFTTADFQFLSLNQAIKLQINYMLNGNAMGKANVVIIGNSDAICDVPPTVNPAIFSDDEDASNASVANGDNNDSFTPNLGDLKFQLAANGNGLPITGYNLSTNQITINGHTYNLSVDANGVISLDKLEFQHLKAGEKVELVLTYTATNANGQSAPADLKLTIYGNQPDAKDDDFSVPAIQAGDSSPSILANDVSEDGDALQIIDVKNATMNGQVATVTANANGTFTIKLNNVDIALVNVDGTVTNLGAIEGKLSFDYTVDGLPVGDVDGEQDTANVAVCFNGIITNNNPPVANNVNYVEDEDGIQNAVPGDLNGSFSSQFGMLRFNLSATDPDGQFEIASWDVDPNSVTINGLATTLVSVQNGIITVSQNGREYTIVPKNDGTFGLEQDDFQYLALGENAVLAFNYTVTDIHGAVSNVANASVKILGNQPTAVNDQYNVIVDQSGSVLGNITGNDSDPDGDVLNVIAIANAQFNGNQVFVNQLPNGSFQLFSNGALLATVAVNGTLTYFGDQVGTITFGYTVDGYNPANLTGEQASANVVINVQPCTVCDKPKLGEMNYSDDEDARDNSGLAPVNGISDNDDGLNAGSLQFELKVTDANTPLDQLIYTINGVQIVNNGVPQNIVFNGIPGHPIDLTFSFINGKPFITVDKDDVQYLTKGQLATLNIPVKVSDGTDEAVGEMKINILGDNPTGVADTLPSTGGNILTNDGVNGQDPDGDILEVIGISDAWLDNVQLNIVPFPLPNNGGIGYMLNLPNGGNVATIMPNGDVTLGNNIPAGQLVFNYLGEGYNPGNNAGEQYNVGVDGNGTTPPSNPGVTIIVPPPSNNNPVAQNITNIEDEDALNSNVQGTWNGTSYTDENDTIQANDLTFKFQATDADNDPLTYSIETGTYSYDNVEVTVAANGTNAFTVTFGANAGIHAGKVFDVTLNPATGEYSFNPAQFQYLKAGEAINIQLKYKANDGQSSSNVATANNIIVGRDINAENDNIPIFENKITELNVLANDNDPDGGVLFIKQGSITSLTIKGPDAISKLSPSIFNAPGLTVLQGGDVLISGSLLPLFIMVMADNKTIKFDSEFFKLEPGQTANVEFNYTATDATNGGMGGEEDDAKVTLVVSDNPDDNTTIVGNPPSNNSNDDSITLITDPETEIDPEIEDSTSQTITPNKTYDDNPSVNGNEDDNIVSGDVKDLTLSIKAGDAYAKANPVTFGGDEFADANTDAIMSNGVIEFGNDNINGNNGDDRVLGDVNILKIAGEQGLATAIVDDGCSAGVATASANVKVDNNTFNFGDDLVKGGKGDDHTIGDAHTIEISYINKNGIEQGNGASVNDDDAWFTNNDFNFGDDTIEGGKENDMLTGDVYKFIVNGQEYIVTGDINSVTAIQDALNTQGSGNTISFGADNFLFDFVNGATGNDTITDFGRGDDKFVIKNLSINGNSIDTFAELQSNSQITQDANGNAVLSIDTNGDGVFGNDFTSVTFNGIDQAEFAAIFNGNVFIFQ